MNSEVQSGGEDPSIGGAAHSSGTQPADVAAANPPSGSADVPTRAHEHGHEHEHSHEQEHDHPHVHDQDHDHEHGSAHEHSHGHGHGHDAHHGHSHGLIDRSITRSRAGLRAVLLALATLGLTAILQAFVFVLSGSFALLADLIHNTADALTALPLGAAFLMRSSIAEERAGLAVVAAILVSAVVAGVAAIQRLIHPASPGHLLAVAAAGAVGFIGNWIAARIRIGAGRRLNSTALIADGNHAYSDAFVSLAVIASAVVSAAGAPVADPLIGLAITFVILRITWASWKTIQAAAHSGG